MDKKNTMLLTVIAVATLLVAVVGATFAYFSVTTGGNSTTTAGVQTGEVGAVALSGGETLHITLAAADMAQSIAGTSYYATNVSTENYKTTQTDGTYDIAKATVTGGDATTTYNCTFDLDVTVGGDMQAALVDGDVSLVIEGAGLDETANLTATSYKYNAKMALTGDEATDKVTAYLVFNNRADVTDPGTGNVTTSGNQNALINKKLEVTIASANFACEIAAANTGSGDGTTTS